MQTKVAFQSGFVLRHSKETAIVKIIDEVLNSNDDGKVAALAILDLLAVFDTIDHDVLLSYLETNVGFKSCHGLGLTFLVVLRLFRVPVS